MPKLIKITETRTMIYAPEDQDLEWYQEHDARNPGQAALADKDAVLQHHINLKDLDAYEGELPEGVEADTTMVEVCFVEPDASFAGGMRDVDIDENDEDHDYDFIPEEDDEEEDDESSEAVQEAANARYTIS